MRVACYARYSSDLQRDTSLDDQVTTARRYAEQQGWQVITDHIYADAGISGASLDGRAGLQALLDASQRTPRPFDVILVDDSSRISRDLADALRTMQLLKFRGVRVIYVSQGIDSASEQADSLIAMHGLVDSLYLKEMAKKIKRGLAGQLERGFVTGGKTYGYRAKGVPTGKTDVDGNPELMGKRRLIDEAEAIVIRQIFEWAASGVGIYTITRRLQQSVPGPWGRYCGMVISRLRGPSPCETSPWGGRRTSGIDWRAIIRSRESRSSRRSSPVGRALRIECAIALVPVYFGRPA